MIIEEWYNDRKRLFWYKLIHNDSKWYIIICRWYLVYQWKLIDFIWFSLLSIYISGNG